MVRLSVALLSAYAVVVQGLSKEKLADWIFSSKGLDQSRAEADRLSAQEYERLSRGRVTLDMLQALKDVMYSSSKLDFGKADLPAALFPLAENRASAQELGALFDGLYSTRGADMNKAQAREEAVSLAKHGASSQDLAPLWKALYGVAGLNLNKNEAQRWIVDLASAGTDSAKLESAFKSYYRTMSKDQAAKAAIQDAIVDNLASLPERFAKDGKSYNAKGFMSYYHDTWLSEWLAAPEERRTAQDGNRYTAKEFKAYYGDAWTTKWTASPVAQEKRMAADGKVYSMQEFQGFYHDTWQSEWFKASEVADDCAFLNHDACDALKSQCVWKWTGDWTDSCVVQAQSTLQV
eukprot:SRR837773.10371.p1 GENE.SRR837773.10371~~SRR837773.10371.p1  ORF type:complete len:357 (+),score=81.80 SRR837773.10371:27-1073(+)